MKQLYFYYQNRIFINLKPIKNYSHNQPITAPLLNKESIYTTTKNKPLDQKQREPEQQVTVDLRIVF